MTMRTLLIACFLGTASLVGQSVVVPSLPPAAEGNAALWAPGFPVPMRQQILVDGAQLANLVGRNITGLELRRNDHQRTYNTGQATWTLNMSTSSQPVSATRPTFAANSGTPTLVFQGTVVAPASPDPLGQPVGWLPSNLITVTFSQPFAYGGGTLCIDIDGIPDPLQTVDSWPVDAVADAASGTVQEIGIGCGAYLQGHWAFVEEETLVVGGSARFTAFGTPRGFGFFVLAATTQPYALPLSIYGASPQCFGHVTNIMAVLGTTFSDEIFPQNPGHGGMTVTQIYLPAATWLLGASFGTQWVDLGQQPMASSNAHLWSVSLQQSQMGVATVIARSDFGPPTNGEVLANLAPVVRLIHD